MLPGKGYRLRAVTWPAACAARVSTGCNGNALSAALGARVPLCSMQIHSIQPRAGNRSSRQGADQGAGPCWGSRGASVRCLAASGQARSQRQAGLRASWPPLAAHGHQCCGLGRASAQWRGQVLVMMRADAELPCMCMLAGEAGSARCCWGWMSNDRQHMARQHGMVPEQCQRKQKLRQQWEPRGDGSAAELRSANQQVKSGQQVRPGQQGRAQRTWPIMFMPPMGAIMPGAPHWLAAPCMPEGAPMPAQAPCAAVSARSMILLSACFASFAYRCQHTHRMLTAR